MKHFSKPNHILVRALLFLVVVYISLAATRRFDVYIISGDIGDMFARRNYEIKFTQQQLYSNLKDFSLYGNVITSTSNDPWIFLDVTGVNVFKYIRLDIDLLSRESVESQFFYLPAYGAHDFSELKSVRQVIKNGINYVRVPQIEHRALRLDLVEEEGVYLVVNSVKLTNRFIPALPDLFLLVLLNVLWCGFWFILLFKLNIKKLKKSETMYCNFSKEYEMNLFKNHEIYKYIWLFPVLYSVIVVGIYGVNILFWDEWSLVPLYESIEQNGFFRISTLQQFFSQHNEHRIFFPGIVLLISHRLTSFNVRVAMFITQIMAIGAYIMYIKYLYTQQKIDDLSTDNLYKKLFVALIGVACFSSIQWENFLWGFQVAFYMAIFCVVVSLYYFHRHSTEGRIKYCVLSIIFGIIASFSSLHGVIVWPVIAVLILICLAAGDRSAIRNSIPYILAGLGCYLLYFYGLRLRLPGTHSEQNIFEIINFFSASIGGVYTGRYSGVTVLLGVLTIFISAGLVLTIFFQGKIKRVLFPIGLMGFSYASLLAIAIGRIDWGVYFSVTSRYMSFSALASIGLIMLMYQFFFIEKKEWLTKKYSNMVILCIIGTLSVLLLWGNFQGLSQARNRSNFLRENVRILQNYENQQLAYLSRIFPWSSYESAYLSIRQLRRNRLNVFSYGTFNHSEVPTSVLNGLTRIELTHWVGFTPQSFHWDERFVRTDGPWVIDYVNQRAYAQVYMNVNGRLHRTHDHIFSVDVAIHFANPNFSNTRFSFAFPIDRMNIGENHFSAIVILNDGLTYYETDIVVIYKNADGTLSTN